MLQDELIGVLVTMIYDYDITYYLEGVNYSEAETHNDWVISHFLTQQQAKERVMYSTLSTMSI